jgi:hypothetical protein
MVATKRGSQEQSDEAEAQETITPGRLSSQRPIRNRAWYILSLTGSSHILFINHLTPNALNGRKYFLMRSAMPPLASYAAFAFTFRSNLSSNCS